MTTTSLSINILSNFRQVADGIENQEVWKEDYLSFIFPAINPKPPTIYCRGVYTILEFKILAPRAPISNMKSIRRDNSLEVSLPFIIRSHLVSTAEPSNSPTYTILNLINYHYAL